MDRIDCLRWVYEQSDSASAGVDFDWFDAFTADWKCECVVFGGEFVGVMMIDGHELHAQLNKAMALKYARIIIAKHVEPLLSKMGYLTSTSLRVFDDIRFLKRIGFYETSETEDAVFFRLDTLKIR